MSRESTTTTTTVTIPIDPDMPLWVYTFYATPDPSTGELIVYNFLLDEAWVELQESMSYASFG